MLESSFRSTLVKNFNAHGYFAKATEVPTCPGWPDITVFDANTCHMVECKMARSPFVHKLFEITQPPFYKEALTKGFTNLFLVVYLERNTFALKEIDSWMLEEKDLRVDDLPVVCSYMDIIHEITCN